ncbi:unnamed protein product [Brachionus calyciflorus]|uniref:Uncharacterized protein n=1 Tax=Brachionus calyciflorus TaxID=104777 RepID=A0A814L7F5_9BILA|nr:unnamed protein product [Brachionus calyciflorus]
MNYSNLKLFMLILDIILQRVAANEWFTKKNPFDDISLYHDKTILIETYPTQFRLKCIQKCLSLDTSCQFITFTMNELCNIFNAVERSYYNGRNNFYFREKRLPRIHFKNGSFLDQNQLINISINFRIDISRSGLNLIVQQAFKNCETVLTLNLSFNNLTQLNSKSFYGMVKLKSLNISYNQISQLESDVFKEVPLLYILELNNNFLKRLDENLFYNLTELESINLALYNVSSNEIKTVHYDTFKSLKQIKRIHIFENQISEINSETFKGAHNLEILSINSNKLQRIDRNFSSNYRNLIDLNMSNNNLSFIEPDFFRGLVKLENLRLYGCQIKQIDLSSLVNLKVLNLAKNKIEYFSQNLSSVTNLYISSNPLVNLTYPLISSENTSVYHLDISNCLLRYTHVNIS